MSLKPPKKSDMKKGWMQPRRDKFVKIQPEYHLLVTEGTKTEPQYFERMKAIVNGQFRERIQLDIYGEGDNTLSLLDKAIRRAKSSSNVYRHVWVIYDTDDFPSEHINKTAEMCKKISNSETEFHAIWSNQCIELWFLLHFGYFHSDIHRKEYIPKLTDWLSNIGQGTYTKGRNDMYEVLRPFLNVAIANAKRLDDDNEGKTPANAAPGTKVYELLEKLLPYLN